jgi:hypothetical protein
MLRYSILFLTLLLLLNACKSSHKLKVVKHKNQNPTLENSDFLYNTEIEEELKNQYKKNHQKRQELEQFQPSRHNNKQEYERTKKKKAPKTPETFY